MTRHSALRIVQVVTGDEVRRLRKKLGLTQEGLAELVGVTANSVARWERGELGVRESAARLMRLIVTQKTAKTKR